MYLHALKRCHDSEVAAAAVAAMEESSPKERTKDQKSERLKRESE